MSIPEFLLTAWQWKPSVVIGCFGLIAAYAWAVPNRSAARTASWFTGVLLIFLALVSPLDALADNYLFSVHMAKHILFVLAVPALLLMGLPAKPVEQALRHRPIAVAESFLSRPILAWAAGVGAMVIWHVPPLFNAASSNEALHIFEHLTLLVGGAIFWWPIVTPVLRLRMQPVPQGIAYLFSACLACTAIGVLITFAPVLLYTAYAKPVDTYGILPAIRNSWEISPAMDQQIGGLLMWVPGCLIYLSATMAMFARWYGEEKHEPVEAHWT